MAPADVGSARAPSLQAALVGGDSREAVQGPPCPRSGRGRMREPRRSGRRTAWDRTFSVSAAMWARSYGGAVGLRVSGRSTAWSSVNDPHARLPLLTGRTDRPVPETRTPDRHGHLAAHRRLLPPPHRPRLHPEHGGPRPRTPGPRSSPRRDVHPAGHASRSGRHRPDGHLLRHPPRSHAAALRLATVAPKQAGTGTDARPRQG
jgi:hypothetical protein